MDVNGHDVYILILFENATPSMIPCMIRVPAKYVYCTVCTEYAYVYLCWLYTGKSRFYVKYGMLFERKP